MNELLSKVSIQVNDCIYLKNPESSELGQKIIAKSIAMIDTLGLEQFTFRKLGKEIGSNEASVYRYFESKHKVLLYLIAWYWGYLEYKLVLGLSNISSPFERLERAIEILTARLQDKEVVGNIDLKKLDRIVIAEASKAYLTHHVDEENKDNVFLGYKMVVAMISDIVMEINPKYKYPHMLISTVIEGAHHQRFFAAHLPRLTDVVKGEDAIQTFYKQMVFNAIHPSPKSQRKK